MLACQLQSNPNRNMGSNKSRLNYSAMKHDKQQSNTSKHRHDMNVIEQLALYISTLQKLVPLPVPPRIIGHKEEEVSVIEGDMVSLLCDVQAYPPPEITWTRDGQVLHFSTGIHILPGQTSATSDTQISCVRRISCV